MLKKNRTPLQMALSHLFHVPVMAVLQNAVFIVTLMFLGVLSAHSSNKRNSIATFTIISCSCDAVFITHVSIHGFFCERRFKASKCLAVIPAVSALTRPLPPQTPTRTLSPDF